MPEAIPTSVLSDAFHEAISGRKVMAAVFTTYTFDPGFFEEEVLPLLFDFSFSHFPKLRLVQLENELRSIDHLAVYYDRRGLITGSGSATLDFRRIPMQRKGFFHPKVVLILVEDLEEDSEEVVQSLIVGVLSANLTRSGWWENVECAQIVEIFEGERCRFRSDLLDLFRWIRRDESTGAEHEALEVIRRFIAYHTEELPYRTSKGVLHPRLFIGQKAFPEFLQEEIRLPEEVYNLEVISPFFDHSEEPLALARLIEWLRPKETRIYLPEDDDGTALCSESFFEAVSQLSGVRWARLPRPLLLRSRSEDTAQSSRFVHAKVYRIWSKSEGKEYLVAGSPNLTQAAHSRTAAGNLEAALAFERDAQTFQPRFWLTPVEEDSVVAFEQTLNEEEPDDSWVPPVCVLYNWDNAVASYFWDTEPPSEFEILSGGSTLGRVKPVSHGQWIELPSSLSDEIGRVLESTSFLEVRVTESGTGTILVREEGMARKPSLLLSLTPEEILRYWSLLSPEQREVFLERKVTELLIQKGLLPELAKSETPPESMFDRFAGIFHAFSSLESRVAKSIRDGHDKDAVYRLFGNKYDSLPNLIGKVLEDRDGDLVNRYVTLLTARQLLQHLKALYPEFFVEHQKGAREVTTSLDRIQELQASFELGSRSDQKEFFSWYGRMFLSQTGD